MGRWQPQLRGGRGAQPHIVVFMYQTEIEQSIFSFSTYTRGERAREREGKRRQRHTQREILEGTGETKNDPPALQVPHELGPTFRFARSEYPTEPSVRPGGKLSRFPQLPPSHSPTNQPVLKSRGNAPSPFAARLSSPTFFARCCSSRKMSSGTDSAISVVPDR